MGNKGVPAPFLTKTYDLVEDPSTNDVISWGENGTTFVVWKSAEFARDLLPNYFKHNNFSSFVRQLNTYAFRKIVPDKWEFANEFFKRGEKELLCEIHRRKPVHVWTPPGHAAGKSNGGPSSQSNSGDDLRSSSTSSPDTKNQVSDETTVTTITQLTNLSGENEKLRRENQLLSSDLARVKKQCEDMAAFFSKCINVAPDQLHQVMMGLTGGPGHGRLVEICSAAHSVGANESDEDDDELKKEGEEECLKLFGVWMKGKKRGRDERGVELPPMKDMKMIGYDAPWMKISSSQGDNSKVCN